MIEPHKIQALRSMARTLREAPGRSGLQSPSFQLASFYDFLADLASGRLVTQRHEIAIELIYPRFQELARLARTAFSPQRSSEMVLNLRWFKENLENPLVWPGPEAGILYTVAKEWLKRLLSTDVKVQLEILLCPSLLPAAEGSPTISVRNASIIPVSDIELSVCLTEEAEPPSQGPPATADAIWEALPAPSLLPPGETTLIQLPFDEKTTGRLTFRWQCVAPGQSGPHIETIRLPVARPRGAVDQGDDRYNPFVPNLPIDHADCWLVLAKGSHAALVGKILSELSLSLGKVLDLRGLRRSGKTTVLRRLAAELEKDSPLLPVYIDIYSWWLPLENRGESIDDAGLYYEIADSILRTTWRLGLDVPLSERFTRDFERNEDGSPRLQLPFVRFEQFLQVLAKDLPGRRPLLLLDEIDSWLDKARFNSGSVALFRKLEDLAEGRLCSAILAHTTSGAQWQKHFADQIPKATFERIEFLERRDVEDLVRLLPAECTAWASELLWKLTGGWPGLTQLLLHMIYEDLVAASESAKELPVVDAARVRSILASFLGSPDWMASRSHLLSSFEPGELEAFRHWVADGSLNPATGELSCTGSMLEGGREVVRGLQEKQVLWPLPADSERHQLRVGILGLVQLTAREAAEAVDGVIHP
ncbi:MAG TPA: hypothetical protein DD490_16275 [Acidobacteria bacterium]|nr:hypothetical protein [Acidobacteriota bacterium]